MSFLKTISDAASRYFAWLVLLSAAAGMIVPSGFLWILPHVSFLLGVIMFGMGLTLTGADFQDILLRPRDVLIGATAQYAIMPLVGYGVAVLFHLPPELAVGVVLVGSCPGGTASNVITWFAKGDVPLSVTITSVTTLLAPLLTPLFTWWLAGQWVPVSLSAMFLSVVKIVLVPVLAGVLVRRFLGHAVDRAIAVLPLVSVTGIMLIIAAVVSVNAARILTTGVALFAAVILHNALGLLLGYFTGKATGMPEPKRRAVAIEVGMQNSGLAVTLAMAHFSPAAAIAGALFSVWQNLSGAILASWWARRG